MVGPEEQGEGLDGQEDVHASDSQSMIREVRRGKAVADDQPTVISESDRQGEARQGTSDGGRTLPAKIIHQ